jgi:hypothetical protein
VVESKIDMFNSAGKSHSDGSEDAESEKVISQEDFN